MAHAYSAPVGVGLAVGLAFIVIFSVFAASSPNQGIKEISIVTIPEGASLESNPAFFVPEVIRVKIGVNNTIKWVSHDTVPHGIAANTGYVDPLTRASFDTMEIHAGFLMPGDTFEFTFNEAGEYPYHGEPHPWIQGTVIVLPP